LKAKVLPALALICATNISFAADISQIINPLNAATQVMNQCAAIAKNISSIKPPAGHVEAREAERFNRTLTKEYEKAELTKAPNVKPKEINPALLKKISPEHQAFLANIRAQRKELQNCGGQYAKLNSEARAIAKKASDNLDSKKSPNEDDKKVGAALVAYMTSGENLSAQISTLSKDSALKPYVNRTIEKFFLGQDVPLSDNN
jgi:hypothetical protein